MAYSFKNPKKIVGIIIVRRREDNCVRFSRVQRKMKLLTNNKLSRGDYMTRMLRFYCLLAISVSLIGCATSKTFAPDASSVINPKFGFLNNEDIDLAIYDGRINKELSDELRLDIANYITKSFPSAKFNILSENDYYADSKPNRITIKIGISTYASAFGTNVSAYIGTFGGYFYYGIISEGHWNGVVGLSVSVFDYRNSKEKKFTQNIGKLVSQPNLWGYATAKQVLIAAYQNVMMELTSLIENWLLS